MVSCVFCVYVLVSSDGSQYSSVPDGMFRKPSEGQSLISYLSEQDFGSCADLEKVRAWSILTRDSFGLVLMLINQLIISLVKL